jgi:hypothetical protein
VESLSRVVIRQYPDLSCHEWIRDDYPCNSIVNTRLTTRLTREEGSQLRKGDAGGFHRRVKLPEGASNDDFHETCLATVCTSLPIDKYGKIRMLA